MDNSVSRGDKGWRSVFVSDRSNCVHTQSRSLYCHHTSVPELDQIIQVKGYKYFRPCTSRTGNKIEIVDRVRVLSKSRFHRT